MAFYRCGGGGIPSSLKTDMNAVLNKKFGTSADYPPADWPDTVNLLGPLPEKTIVSSPIADFQDGADDVPTKSLIVTIPATLSGVSTITETQTGKNLLDESLKKINGRNIYYNTGINQNDGYSCVLPAGTYTFSVTTADGTITNLYARNYDTSTNISGFPAYGVLKKTFTLSETTRVSFWIYKDTYTSLSDIVNAQVEFGSTDTAHADYTAPTTYTAQLGRTVYGGTADIVNGTGQETFGVFTFDGSDNEDWSYSNGRYKITVQGTFEVFNTNHYRIRQCNNLTVDNVAAGSYELADNSVTWFSTNNIFIRKDDVTSLENWKQYLQNNPLKIGGNLATPTDFTFTGQEIPTMLGYNAFWSDQGDTEITYRADINLALGGQ